MAVALSFLPLEKKHIADFITETSTWGKTPMVRTALDSEWAMGCRAMSQVSLWQAKRGKHNHHVPWRVTQGSTEHSSLLQTKTQTAQTRSYHQHNYEKELAGFCSLQSQSRVTEQLGLEGTLKVTQFS